MNRLFTLLLLLLLAACGPNAQERADMQQRHDDSIKTATEAETTARLKKEKKEADREAKLEDKIRRFNEIKPRLEYEIMNQTSKLVVYKDQYNQDAQYHFGRLNSHREYELKRDADNIQITQNNINELQNRLNNVNDFLEKHNATPQ